MRTITTTLLTALFIFQPSFMASAQDYQSSLIVEETEEISLGKGHNSWKYPASSVSIFDHRLNQESEESWLDGISFDIGLYYGSVDQSIGIGVGLIQTRVDIGSISYGNISLMRRNSGIDTWGEKFDNVGQNEFRSDIVDSGRRIDMVSGELGLKVYKYTHAIVSLGYEATFLVQQRDDSTTILGDNGRYWTDYRISDESNIAAGGGLMVRVPVTNGVSLTPKVLFSTAKNVQLSLGFAFGGSSSETN